MVRTEGSDSVDGGGDRKWWKVEVVAVMMGVMIGEAL